MDELTDLALRAKSGEADAFASLVRRTQGEMWRYVARMTDSQRADDVTQDVYVRIWKALPSFTAASSARTWLYGVAHHVVADHVRTVSRRRRLLAKAGLFSVPTAIHGASNSAANSAANSASSSNESMQFDAVSQRDHTESSAIEDFVRSLNADHRSAFVLTQVLGFSYAESAEILSIPIGTVRSRLARAREALSNQIEASEAV